MRWSETSKPERRHDARVQPGGEVRVRPLPGQSTRGRLVNVSARGLCLQSTMLGLRVGQPVDLLIELEEEDHPAGDPSCVLEGTGRVVWVCTERVRCLAGLRFDRPVSVKTPFQRA